MSSFQVLFFFISLCRIYSNDILSAAEDFSYNLDEAASVIIKSSGFPFNYPSDLNQSWTFIAKDGFRLELLEFELEEGYDFLYIRYGLNPDVPESSVITLSGSYDEGTEYYIGAPEMWLFMTSDSSLQHQGFHVNVSAFDTSSIDNCDDICNFKVDCLSVYLNCTLEINQSVSITSQNYPGNYTSYSDTKWKVYTNENLYLEVVIVSMSVSTGNDHVQLFLSDYIPKRGAVPLMIDGDEAGSRYYSKGEVGVRFFTEGGVGQGFHLNITIVQSGALSVLPSRELCFYDSVPTEGLPRCSYSYVCSLYKNKTCYVSIGNGQSVTIASNGFPMALVPSDILTWYILADEGSTLSIIIEAVWLAEALHIGTGSIPSSVDSVLFSQRYHHDIRLTFHDQIVWIFLEQTHYTNLQKGFIIHVTSEVNTTEDMSLLCADKTETFTITNEKLDITSRDNICLWTGVLQNPSYRGDTFIEAEINFFTGVDGADNYLSIGEGSSPENGSSVIFNHSNIHYGVDFFMQRFYLQSESIWVQYRSYRIKMAFNISLSIVDKKDNCSENQFTCNDGNCIDNFGVETGYFDCFDGSDEDVYTDFVDCSDPFSSLFNGYLSDPGCLEWDNIALLRTRGLPGNICLSIIYVTDTVSCFKNGTVEQRCHTNHCYERAGCYNNNGSYYRDLAMFTENGFRCIDWDDVPAHVFNISDYQDAGFKENFCRNPDGWAKPWCFYTDQDGNLQWKTCAILECTLDSVLHQFRRYPRTYYHDESYAYDSNDLEYGTSYTEENCALNCFNARFTCLSFIFEPVKSPAEKGICKWSSASPNVNRALAELPENPQYDVFVRIDQECDPLKIPSLPEKCSLPVMIRTNATNIEALRYTNLFKFSKLGSNQCWRPTNPNETLTLNLPERYVIGGVIVHGCDDDSLGWVKTFSVTSGYNDYPQEIIGIGNAEPRCPSMVTLKNPAYTTVIRVKPETVHIGIAMKVDLLGCRDNDCDDDLGVISKTLPDTAFSSSSSILNDPSQVRYQPFDILRDSTKGWVGEVMDEMKWIQVTYESLQVIRSVVIKGCKQPYPWVTSFKVAYGNEIDDLLWILDGGKSDLAKVFPANFDRNTPNLVSFDKELIALMIRIYPVTPTGQPCMKMTVIGCPYRKCYGRLGMESGHIEQTQIETSSSNSCHQYGGFRLFGYPDFSTFSITAHSSYPDQFIMIDLLEDHVITAIATQGTFSPSDISRNTFPSYYVFQFQTNNTAVGSTEWQSYRNIDGTIKVFDANEDAFSVVINKLDRPVVATKVQLIYGRNTETDLDVLACLRMELFGCKLSETGNVCGSGGLEIQGSCFGTVQNRSQTACRDIFQSNSHHAIINTEDLRNALYSDFDNLELANYHYYRIGLNLEHFTNGTLNAEFEPFYWYDGSPATYTNFKEEVGLEDYAVTSAALQSFCVYLSLKDSFSWLVFECNTLTITPGALCQMDIDECHDRNKPCSHVCVNTPGSYYCACPDGFYVNPEQENSCLSLCSFIGYDAFEGNGVCVSFGGTIMTKQEATQECEEIEGALLDSFYTSSIQKDQSLRDVLSRGIWLELPLPEAADVCHVLIGNESFITTNITNCDSRHNFICMRNYPDSFKIDGGCVEGRRRSQERCPIENVYYNEGYLSWVASPRFYQHMTTTIFHILVRPGYQIRINFASINLRIDDKLSCVDSLELVENLESSQSVKGMYCGDIKKLIFQLETNNVTLSLKIGPLLDEMSGQLSLHAYFEGLNCTLDDCTTQCPSEPFTKSFGEIFTYNFPAALSQFFECAWTIIVSNGFYIRVDFTYLDISCSLSSSLVIYDFGNDFESDFSKPPKYDLCGHQGISLVSSGNMLRIDLRNLGERFSTGFHATYRETEIPGCGFFPVDGVNNGVSWCNASSAMIASPNFPNPSPTETAISWLIVTSPGTYISVNFTVFDISLLSRTCEQAQLTITEYSTASICNKNIHVLKDGVYYSHSNNITLRLLLNNENDEGRFFAIYKKESFVANTLPSREDAYCEKGWTLSSNDCYRVVQSSGLVTWLEAQETCQDWSDESSYLVAIHSQLEMDFVQELILKTGNPELGAYIGLWWDESERAFRWVNGQPLTFSDWTIDRGYTSRQPDGGGLEGCGLIDFWSYRETSNWWDIPCAAYRTSQFVCQQKAQSTTADVIDSTSFRNTTLIYTEDVNQVCKENHFRCSSGECILEVYLCDSSRDCSDGSDEEDCNRNKGNIMHSCQPTEYECDDGSCIAAAFFCDSIMNCRDGSDEYSCDRPNCTDDEVRCQGGRCIPQTALCDLKNDCGDNSDETECTWSEGNFGCFANLLLPGNRVCDGYRDCAGKNWEDEPQTCDYLQDLLLCNKTSQFQCRNGACVPPSTICIHEMDEYNYPKGCRDASHLKDCESFQCPVGYFKCPNTYCIPERYRCNNILDCPLGEDEINCSHYTCASGSYKCHNQQVCLHQDQICDGLLHCAEDDDELFCDAGCFDGCSCTGLSFNCTSSPWKPDYAQGLPRQLRQLVLSGAQRIERTARSLKLNASGDMSIKGAVYINLINYPYLLNLDLSSNGIEIILPGEFERSINLKFLILSYNQIYSIERKCFIGLSKLEYLNLVGNPLMRFGQQPFSLLYHLRTLDIQETHIENVDNDLFTGLHSLGNLYSDRFFFCCLAKFVIEVETCTPDAGQFSSCQDLMKNKFLRVSLWILGLAAVLGNGGVIFWRIYRKEIIPTNSRNPAQSILISNLAIADFLLGVYMLIIGVADISFRSVYYQYSETWQTSALCKFAGFLSVLGSEGSVMLLAVITADRFQGIVFPFSSKKLRFKSTLVVSGVVWFLAFSFSAIPLIPFDYFGVSYYGRSSVCLALPLTNDFLPGWLYSVLIFLLFNFICFLLMFLCYIVIYIKASRSVAFQGSMKSKRQSNKVEEQLQVASKMAFLVATDMACWLPIIIMGFLSVIGAVEIPDVIYAWTAVFIMPVNSALNPYLYTVFVNASRRKSVNTSVKSISQGYDETEAISSIQLLESTKKEDLMKSVCSDFKRRRIILAMTMSGIEKYSLANLRKRESFILTENNRIDFTDDIKKAVTFLHEKGVCHRELSEDYVIIDEFPNGEKRAFLLLPFNLLMTSRLIGEDNPEQKPSTKEDDLAKLEELVRHFEDLQ